MLTLDDHLKGLVKHTSNTREEILLAIETNYHELTENFLIVWSISEEADGKVMYVLFGSGDGLKAMERLKEIAKKGNCKRIYCVTQRPRGMEKKLGFKPVGVLMMQEV